jgi:hypothetical protein
MKAYMKEWLTQLRAGIDQKNFTSTTKETRPTVPPLRTQIDQLFAEMPAQQRERPWSIHELARLMQGKYGPHPNPQKIAPILRSLGWVSSRVWARDGYGKRLWHPPYSRR